MSTSEAAQPAPANEPTPQSKPVHNDTAPIAAGADANGSALEAQSDDTSSDTDDSGIGSEYDPSSYTASLTSSITAYQYEHGRRYHAYQAGKPANDKSRCSLDNMGLIESIRMTVIVLSTDNDTDIVHTIRSIYLTQR